MQPVNATRAGRSVLALTSLLAIAILITIAIAAVVPAGSSADRGRGGARTAGACDGTASLGLTDRHPRQLRPIRFSAAGSSVPPSAVAFYDFNYGDGSDDASAQPTAAHAYQESGSYTAKVSIVTSCNTIVSSPDVRVVVADGLPPAVSIGFPRANQIAHFGRSGLLLSGTAIDPSGVRRVELAIQLVSLERPPAKRASAAASRAGATRPAKAPVRAGCYWYDGKITLRLRGCATPLFFAASVSGSRWSFRMNPRSQIPPGGYVARVRATDRAGNASTVFSPQLRDILAFTLVA